MRERKSAMTSPENARKSKRSFSARLARSTRTRMISGLLVLVPLVVTYFVLQFLYKMSVGTLLPLLNKVDLQLPEYAKPPVALLVVFVAIYVAGLLAGNYVGRKVIALGEAILRRIPVVKTVYSASKQVVDTFSIKDKQGFKRVALVEYPRPGIYALGFVTGEIRLPDGRNCYIVFIPTSPNPTSGFLEAVPMSQAELLDLSIEETLRVVMSAGILSPESLVRASDASPEKTETS